MASRSGKKKTARKKPAANSDRIKDFRRVRIGDLAENPRNWRTHPEDQRRAMAAVLAEVGIADAVLARETPDGLELIDGHLRRDLDPDATWPVLVLDVTEAEADVILATHDPLAVMAGVDPEKLAALLAEIETTSDGLQAMLDDLAKDAAVDLNGEVVEDAGPDIDRADELREKWGTERGQVWEIVGPSGMTHRLMCGDSTCGENVNTLRDDVTFEMMFADPPYGVDYDGGHFHSGDVNVKRSRDRLVNDDSTDIYSRFLNVSLPLIDGPCYVFFAGTRGRAVFDAVEDSGGHIHAMLIWHKTNATYAAMNSHYKQRHEPFLYFKRQGATLRWNGPSDEATVWDMPRDSCNDMHPTQKPTCVPVKAISNHDCQTIYDPFLGSGTTMVAAEQLGRRCFGMEIEPKYVAVALERMKALGCDCRMEYNKKHDKRRTAKKTKARKKAKTAKKGQKAARTT